jgi:hypothetical protein
MRHRLYYLLPDMDSARKTFDDLLLNRIEQQHIHFLTNGTPLPLDLPEANFLQKTDVVHGARSGMLAGALTGILAGALIIFYFDMTQDASGAMLVLATTAGGLLFGGWTAGMIGAGIPNSRYKDFYPEIEKGKVLMIADVPAGRVKQIEQVLAERHPELTFRGEAPDIPAFP